SRFLATELGLSRLTVVTAIDQLVAEGYVEARRGSGTFVANVLPPAGDRISDRTSSATPHRPGNDAVSPSRVTRSSLISEPGSCFRALRVPVWRTGAGRFSAPGMDTCSP